MVTLEVKIGKVQLINPMHPIARSFVSFSLHVLERGLGIDLATTDIVVPYYK
jgi:hypothetical protein